MPYCKCQAGLRTSWRIRLLMHLSALYWEVSPGFHTYIWILEGDQGITFWHTGNQRQSQIQPAGCHDEPRFCEMSLQSLHSQTQGWLEFDQCHDREIKWSALQRFRQHPSFGMFEMPCWLCWLRAMSSCRLWAKAFGAPGIVYYHCKSTWKRVRFDVKVDGILDTIDTYTDIYLRIYIYCIHSSSWCCCWLN